MHQIPVKNWVRNAKHSLAQGLLNEGRPEYLKMLHFITSTVTQVTCQKN